MKRSQDFHFKQFSIKHNNSAHKVGTDAVIVGAWSSVENVNSVLDIGTGSGIIALMIAQRTNQSVIIDAVEIQQADADEAKANVKASAWSDRVFVHHISVDDFFPVHKYDLIISNPPFFVNSLLPPENPRSIARHTKQLTFEMILKTSDRLLNAKGRLVVILPMEESKIFNELASRSGFFQNRRLSVKSRATNPIERVVTEYSKTKKELTEESLVIHDTKNEWSDEYKKLTKDFYLKA